MKCVIYTRVSSKEQEKEGFSIPAQEKLLREYAHAKGFDITREFCDIESAKAAGRSQFQQMVTFLKSGKSVRTVLVEKTDRLYRNFRDLVILEDLEIEIHLVKENEILSKDSRSSTKLTHNIKVVLAKNYIDNLSEEVKKGLKEKAEQGEWPHRAPYGYMNNKITKLVEPHPEVAAYVRELFALFSTGQYSLERARMAMFGKGLRSSAGRPLSKSMIEAILTNVFYVGDFVWAGNTYKGKHQPLVDRELFDSVGTLLRGGARPRVRVHDFAYRGLLKCGRCGSAIVGEVKKERYIYYHCTNAKGKCSQPYVRQEVLDKSLEQIVKSINVSASLAVRIQQALSEHSAMEKRTREQERRKLSLRFDQLQSWIQKSYEDRLNGVIDAGYWTSATSGWRAEQDQIKVRLAAFDKASRNFMDTASEILELAQSAHSRFVKQDSQEKRRLLNTLVSNCTLDGLTVCPTYKKPFDYIAEGLKMQTMLPRQDSNQRPAD